VRDTFIDVAGVTQPAPAPRFSRTVPGPVAPPSAPGADSAAILSGWGWTDASIETLRKAKVI
jgi:alpha-methylacyl-CoA racemase